MRLIILGASGLTGSEVLDLAIDNPLVKEITCVLRNSTGRKSDKLNEIIIDSNQMTLFEGLPEADAIICCLGTTIKKAGSREAFRFVDVDLPLHFASVGCKRKVKSFLLQSSIGAGGYPKGFYLKCKTEVEEKLKKLDYKSLVIVRPSLLLGNRNEFRLGEKVGEFFMKLSGPLFFGSFKKYKAIPAKKVAERLVQEALNNNTGIKVIESDEI